MFLKGILVVDTDREKKNELIYFLHPHFSLDDVEI